jgi:hypothetical protein
MEFSYGLSVHLYAPLYERVVTGSPILVTTYYKHH